ncbi:MAG: hypothetical protein JSW45_08660 [Thiotrichales bacterium]|nr:MAG: hypothetical protein JSW45_08660 [Thiotrichales bacterium]
MNLQAHSQYLSILLVFFLFIISPPTHAQSFGEVVVQRGMIDDDLYMAGAQVDLYATVSGDVVVAGGRLNLEGEIKADLTAAGGTISLRSQVADDARLAAGEIRVASRVGDDLVAAAGRIYLAPTAEIAGRAWLGGGDVRVDGRVTQELRASGGRVVISGTIDADASLWADQVVIEDGAVIKGNLHYTSPHPAVIRSGARIDGEVLHTPVDVDLRPMTASVIFTVLVVVFSFMLTGVVVYLIFTEFFVAVSQSLRLQPWLCLGIGLAVVAGIPVLMVILFSSVIGIWLALLLLALYLVLLLAGYFAGALSVADAGLNLMNKTDISRAARASALAAAVLVLAVLNLIPLLGSLFNWAVLLAGTGALGRRLYLLHRA